MNRLEILEKRLINSCDKLSQSNEDSEMPVLDRSDLSVCNELLDNPPNKKCVSEFENNIFGNNRAITKSEVDDILKNHESSYNRVISDTANLIDDINTFKEEGQYRSENKELIISSFKRIIDRGLDLLNNMNNDVEKYVSKISSDFSNVEDDQYKELVNSYYKISENRKKVNTNNNEKLTSKKQLETFESEYNEISKSNIKLIVALTVMLLLTGILYYIFVRF